MKLNINQILLLLLTFMLSYNCSGIDKKVTFRNDNIKKLNSNSIEKSKEKIDKGTTYEVFFKLQKQVDCIKIIISSTYEADKFYRKLKSRKVYFIIEKIISLSHFNKAGKKKAFFELGKNYNKDWFSRNEILICSPRENPIMKLDNISEYRIRFTTFNPGESFFRINIKADCKVILYDSKK